MTKFPTIGEYNQLIIQKGGAAFDSLFGIEFIASKSYPIKIFVFGSGAFAAVFKGGLNGNYYAIRCFLSIEDETIERYRIICNYLKNIHSSWITNCELIEDEISFKGKWLPILKMDWVDGLLIDKFVKNNINNNDLLSQIQQKLVAISQDLEHHNIGHGDLQCGNIIISGPPDDFDVKLIDYDGMYVDGLPYNKSLEQGRSEFQHPRRTSSDYNSKMDRFSVWVIVTALEALKYDKSLWNEVMHRERGFNTLDNFLFTNQDFLNPNESRLFRRIQERNEPSLNFYLEKLKYFCSNDISKVSAPKLFEISNATEYSDELNSNSEEFRSNNYEIPNGKIRIISNVGSVPILSTSFQRIGFTPIDLDKSIYSGKTIVVSYANEAKQIELTGMQNLIEVNF